jgi:hypothetical protein
MTLEPDHAEQTPRHEHSRGASRCRERRQESEHRVRLTCDPAKSHGDSRSCVRDRVAHNRSSALSNGWWQLQGIVRLPYRWWVWSTCFAPMVCMAHVTHSIRSVADTVERTLGRVTAVIIGFVLMVIGLAMTVSIVMLPVGVVVGLLGVGLFVAGLFAHIDQEG